MLKHLLVAAGLAFSCAACATPAIQGVPGQPPFAAELEPYEEAVDRSCAYFNFLWGKSAEIDGRYDEAVYAYKQAIVCDRQAGAVMRSLAAILVKTGQKEQAVVWMNRLLEVEQDDLNAKTFLANLYSSMEKFAEAISLYQEILRADARNFNARLLLGSLHARMRDYPKARQTMEQLVADHPDSHAAFYYLAKLYQEMGLPEKAGEALNRAISLQWSPMLAYELAELHEQGRDYPEAIAIYQKIIAENGADEKARGLLATVYLRQGKVDQALEEMEKMLAVSANPARVELAIARLLLESGRRLEAIARLNAILKKEPQADGARSLLILAYYQQEDLASAKKLLQQVPPSSPAYEESVIMLARILYGEKDLAGAEKTLRQAMGDKDHRRLSFYVALAAMYEEENRPSEARSVFTQAFADFPGNADVYYEYAMFLHKQGDPAGALREMEEAIKREPRHARALNYVGYTWADEGRNLDQAKAYIEQAVALLPKDGFVRDSLGWVYYRLGDFPAAVRELEIAVSLSPNDYAIYEHLGDAYLKNNEPDKAAEAFEKAIEFQQETEKKEELRRKRDSILPGGVKSGEGK